MHLIDQDWIIKIILGFILAWVSVGTVALFAFLRCQYCDRKVIDPRTDPWLFFGVESPFMFFIVAVIGLFGILAWPLLIKEKRNYELGIHPDYSLN